MQLTDKKEAFSERMLLLCGAFFFFEYIRPNDWVPGVSALKLPFILQCCMWFALIKLFDKKVLGEKTLKLTIFFILSMAVMIPFAWNNFTAYKATKEMFLYFSSGVLPVVLIVSNIQRVKKFFHWWVLIHLLLALVVLKNGGTGPGGILADENDVALALNMGLPFALYLVFSPFIGKGVKMLYWGVNIIIIIGIVTSFSRGGLLGLTGVLLGIWWLTGKRFKWAVIGVSAGVVFYSLVLNILPSGYIEDMVSMGDDSDGTRNERLYSWGLGWDMFKDYPVFGVGPSNYPWRVAWYDENKPDRPENQPPIGGREAHSVYFTLLPELGSFGTTVWLLILFHTYRNLSRVIKGAKVDPDDPNKKYLSLLAKACLAGHAGYLVSGAFISVLYYPLYWYLMALGLVIFRCYRNLENEKTILDAKREEKLKLPTKGRALT